MAAGGVVALEFIINFCRCAELFFEAVRAHERRRAVHLVEIADLLRNGDIRGVVVQLLLDQLVAEYRAQIVEAHGLAGAGVYQGRGLCFHVRADIVPILGHLRLRQIDLVRNIFGFHGASPFACWSLREKGNKKDLRPQRKPVVGLISWDKSLKNFCGATQIDNFLSAHDAPLRVLPNNGGIPSGSTCFRVRSALRSPFGKRPFAALAPPGSSLGKVLLAYSSASTV